MEVGLADVKDIERPISLSLADEISISTISLNMAVAGEATHRLVSLPQVTTCAINQIIHSLGGDCSCTCKKKPTLNWPTYGHSCDR
eukprot:1215890-Amphidinium_carterae.1